MFRLKSNALQREFKVNEGYLYASRIRNTRSGMDLVPDGNSTEFTFPSGTVSWCLPLKNLRASP